MAVSAKAFGQVGVSLANGEIDFDTHTLKVMLCASSYTPNQDTHRYKSSVTGEISGSGYAAGGAVLTNVQVSYDAATNTTKVDANDTAWDPSALVARYAVIYDDTPSLATAKPLIGYVDFGVDVTSQAGPFSITWDSGGILALAVA